MSWVSGFGFYLVFVSGARVLSSMVAADILRNEVDEMDFDEDHTFQTMFSRFKLLCVLFGADEADLSSTSVLSEHIYSHKKSPHYGSIKPMERCERNGLRAVRGESYFWNGVKMVQAFAFLIWC